MYVLSVWEGRRFCYLFGAANAAAAAAAAEREVGTREAEGAPPLRPRSALTHASARSGRYLWVPCAISGSGAMRELHGEHNPLAVAAIDT